MSNENVKILESLPSDPKLGATTSFICGLVNDIVIRDIRQNKGVQVIDVYICLHFSHVLFQHTL